MAHHRAVRALASTTLLLALTTIAAAQPADKLPPRVEEAAREAFLEAQAADQAGDLTKAIERYRYAQKIASHPNVTYNLADVLRRSGDVRAASREYRAYLKAMPDAPDTAKVEKVIAALEATPGTIEVDSRATDIVLYLDGKRQGPAPITVELSPGPHRFEGITPISYKSMVHNVDFARKSSFSLTPPARVDGNLIISGSGHLERTRVEIDGPTTTARVGDLIPLAPGKHKLEVVRGDCRWDKTVDPPHGDILYVYFDVAPPKPPRPVKVAKGQPTPPPPKPACGKAKVTIERIKFPTP